MNSTPKSLRLQIGVFGETNSGKSSFVNYIIGQDISIVSSIEGTTTDVVEKSVELLPIGPVTFLDTAGLSDTTSLSNKRIEKTKKIFDRADIFVIVTTGDKWGSEQEYILAEAEKRNKNVLVIINKIDVIDNFILEKLKDLPYMELSAINKDTRDTDVSILKEKLLKLLPKDFVTPPPLIGDLIKSNSLVVLIVPIDLQAPKGRLILPQVQTIRDVLDNDSAVLVVKEREYLYMLNNMKIKPDLVVCDSQVVLKMMADTPKDIKATTFSILFARLKGELTDLALGAKYIDNLKTNDNVLISEACSHHALEDDIGRVKIPRWLRQYTGLKLNIDVVAGRDYPEDLEKYSLIIHCGSCMLTRNETLIRIEKAKQNGVAITNYGTAISYLQGVLERALEPFESVLEKYRNTKF